MTANHVARALGASRIAYGVALLAAPDWAQRFTLGLDPGRNHTGAYLARVTGSRELVVGVLGAGLAGEDAARAMTRWGILVDAADVASATSAYRAGRHRMGPFLALAGAGLGAVAAGLYAAADG